MSQAISFGSLNLLENFKLQFGINIGQKNVFGFAIGFRQLRMKGFENVEVGLQGLRFIQVVTITTLPAERLSRHGSADQRDQRPGS